MNSQTPWRPPGPPVGWRTGWSSAPVGNRCCSWMSAAVRGAQGARVLRGRRDQRHAGPPAGVDWLCVSPKIGADLVVDGRPGTQVRLSHRAASTRRRSRTLTSRIFRVQPMDGPDVVENTAAAVKFCLDHPNWQLSLQTHKYLGIP